MFILNKGHQLARLSEKNSEIKRLKILDKALSRFSKSGFNGVTMRDIAVDASIPLIKSHCFLLRLFQIYFYDVKQ